MCIRFIDMMSITSKKINCGKKKKVTILNLLKVNSLNCFLNICQIMELNNGQNKIQ